MDAYESWLALKSKSGDELLAEFVCPIKREYWLPPPTKKPAPAAAAAPAAALEDREPENGTAETAANEADSSTSSSLPPPLPSSNGNSGKSSRQLAARLRQREARSMKQCREWARTAECPWGDDCIFAHGDKPGKVSRGGGGGGDTTAAEADAVAAVAAAPKEIPRPPPPPPPPLPGRCPVDAAWPGSCKFGGCGEDSRCRWATHGGGAEDEGEREEKVGLLCSLRQRRLFDPMASSSTNALSAACRTALFEGSYDFSLSIAVLDSLGLSHGVTGRLAAQARARARRKKAARKKKEAEEAEEGGEKDDENGGGGDDDDDDATASAPVPASAAAAAAAAALAVSAEEGDGGGGGEGTLFYRETGLHPRERAAAAAALSLDLRGKLYLAPLTTVGNLPFRALAVSLGADVTCSEMALANNLLQGKGQEWALLKRHPSERLFGAQVAGGHADALARAAQLVSDATDADFLDINMGCPIDLIAHKGAGAGLLARPRKVEALVRAVSGALAHPSRLRDLPLTLKVRKGVRDGADSVHSWLPLVAAGQWGSNVAAATIHGRSKQQRYSKDSDWRYVGECARICADANPGFQVISSGDVSSFREYEAVQRSTGGAIAGVMLARGALVKPWLFTEIAERRDIDLRSSERLELYRQFVSLGLGHWGSDARGVETTRRFFLEWMGFAHRYVPVGLVEEEALRRDAERAATAAAAESSAIPAAVEKSVADEGSDAAAVPVKPSSSSSCHVSLSARRMLRLRTPRYEGRDDLETLLASAAPADWVKVSEMLLGPAPPGFRFEPKHKSNAYSASAVLDGDAERAGEGGGAGGAEAGEEGGGAKKE